MPLYRLRYLASRRSPTQYRSVSGRYWSRGWVDLETREFACRPVDDTIYLLAEAVEVSTQVAPPDNLVLELTFYEGSGTVAHDSSKYGNHGTIYGAVWTQENGVYALHFDGVDDYVLIPSNPSLDLTQQLTIEAVVKIHGITYYFNRIFTRHAYTTAWETNPYQLGYFNSKQFGFVIGDGATYNVLRFGSFEFGKFYHVVAVMSDTELLGYVNGKLEATTSRTITPTTTTADAAIAKAGTYYYNFDIVLLRIWSRALTDAKIVDLYEAIASVLPLG